MTQTTYDVMIVGGGIMGSATAYNLVKLAPRLRVAVVERDPAYTHASTTLSMSNIRIQFSLMQNVRISQYAFEVLERFDEEMAVEDRRPNTALRREGNLFLVAPEDEAVARSTMAMQQALGCDVRWLTPQEIQHHYPLYKSVDLAGGTFSPMDGHIDAYGVLMGYHAKARSMGVTYISDEVIAVSTAGGQAKGVRLSSGTCLEGPVVVNCAGAWAAELAQSAGAILPVAPVKRQIFVMDPAVKPQAPLPLTVLPAGLFFRTDTGGLLLMGKSMPEDPVGFDFSWDEERFMEVLWPELAEFVPAFDTLKLIRGWAGLYAVNTLDGNAILGEWPELKGFFLANGFSGHGLQQAPAVGRYLAELIVGQSPALDLSVFGPERILAKQPVSEVGLV